MTNPTYNSQLEAVATLENNPAYNGYFYQIKSEPFGKIECMGLVSYYGMQYFNTPLLFAMTTNGTQLHELDGMLRPTGNVFPAPGYENCKPSWDGIRPALTDWDGKAIAHQLAGDGSNFVGDMVGRIRDRISVEA